MSFVCLLVFKTGTWVPTTYIVNYKGMQYFSFSLIFSNTPELASIWKPLLYVTVSQLILWRDCKTRYQVKYRYNFFYNKLTCAKKEHLKIIKMYFTGLFSSAVLVLRNCCCVILHLFIPALSTLLLCCEFPNRQPNKCHLILLLEHMISLMGWSLYIL